MVQGSMKYASAGYDFALIANNPASGTTGQIVAEIQNYENDDFRQAFLPSLDTSVGAVNTGKLIGRNNTLSNLTDQQLDQNQLLRNTFNNAKDTYTRQGEINEWQAQNKLDTLFFLQILFLYFFVIIVLLYLRQYMVLDGNIVYGIILFLLLVVAGVLWNRMTYTNMSRDTRYWNRRYISTDAPVAVKKCEP